MTNAEFVAGLRELADFFEARPELAPPYGIDNLNYYGYVDEDCQHTVDSKTGVAFFVKTVGGKITKSADSSFFRMSRKVGPFSIVAISNRESICERVKVGERIEPERIIPAQPEQHIPAKEEEFIPSSKVDVYEWRCPSILAEKEEYASA